jgi:general secretion pathway protein M
MSERFQLWWAERSRRERHMLVIMLAMVAAFAAWFLVWQPISKSLVAARIRHEQAVRDVAGVAAKAAQLKAILATPAATPGGPVPSYVSQSASNAGFTLSRADPVGTDGVTISIVSAKSPALFAWLATLDAGGIFVAQLDIRPNTDATIAVDATLKARPQP